RAGCPLNANCTQSARVRGPAGAAVSTAAACLGAKGMTSGTFAGAARGDKRGIATAPRNRFQKRRQGFGVSTMWGRPCFGTSCHLLGTPSSVLSGRGILPWVGQSLKSFIGRTRPDSENLPGGKGGRRGKTSQVRPCNRFISSRDWLCA